MVEQSKKVIPEPIDNLVGLVRLVNDNHGKEKRDELIDVICGYVNIKDHSFKTNYMNKRAYDKFKVKMALPIAQKFIQNL